MTEDVPTSDEDARKKQWWDQATERRGDVMLEAHSLGPLEPGAFDGSWLLLDLPADVTGHLSGLVKAGEYESSEAAAEAILREHMRVTKDAAKATADPEIWEVALTALGDEHETKTWMLSPQMALDQRRPVDLLDDPDDRRELLDQITRIAHGVYT